MPRMNGIEFLHELGQDPALKHTVVFVLPTSLNNQDRLDAYAHNITGYVLKQNVGEDFVNALRLLDNYQTLVVLPN
jgi:CheY-like chemotaxis protein